MVTLKFRCTRIDVEEKTSNRFEKEPERTTRVGLYFESPDLMRTDTEFSTITMTLTLARFQELGYEVGKVYELVTL